MSGSASVETGSTHIGRELHEAGVGVLFGVMGESNVDMISVMVQRLGTRYIAARHEQGAVSMAEGYARTTGGIGVATVTYGPGAGNAVTAVTSAARHGSAVLVVGGHRTSRDGPPQYHDPVAMFEPTGALVMRIDDPAEAAGSIGRAIRTIRSRRGPVVLSYADTILEAPFTPAPARAGPASAVTAASPASSDREAIAKFAAIFATAERPAILAGRGAIAAGASAGLARLSDMTGAALITSLLGHGQFGGAASAVGISGGLATPAGARVMREADAVLVVGASLNGWTSDAGRAFGNAAILHVDAASQAFERAYLKAPDRLVGDAAEVTERMIEAVAALGASRPSNAFWWDEPGEENEDRRPMETGAALDPFAFARAVDAALPEQRTLIVDGGHFFESICRSIRVPDERGFVWTLGYGSIGLGLASAIGAAIGRPDRLAVLGIGDGGLLMSLAELETVPRYGVPLLILVMNDAAYGAEVKFVEEKGWDGSVARFPDTDFAAVARALGMDAVTVRTKADVESLLPRLRQLESALLVDAKIDQSATAEFMTLLNDLKAPR